MLTSEVNRDSDIINMLAWSLHNEVSLCMVKLAGLWIDLLAAYAGTYGEPGLGETEERCLIMK